jgi:hypothetical protein
MNEYQCEGATDFSASIKVLLSITKEKQRSSLLYRISVLCRLLVIQKIKSAACNSEESVGWWFK